MTKKDYTFFARILHEVVQDIRMDAYSTPEQVVAMLMARLCARFPADNPKFDADKFRDAVYAGKGI